MPISSSVDQGNHLPPPDFDQHVETLSETQFTHDIVRQVSKPVSHIPYRSTSHLSVRSCRIPVKFTTHNGTELTNMQEHNVFHALERMIRKCLTQHTPLSTMYSLIDCIVSVIHPLDGWEGIVEVCLLQSLPMAVDIM